MASKRRETWGAKENSTMFKNQIKSLIQHCERSELLLHFEWTQAYQKCQKLVHFSEILST